VVQAIGNGVDDVYDRKERRAEFLRALSAGDKVWGRVRNIVDYGAFIDLGCVDRLLHVSGIPLADQFKDETRDVTPQALRLLERRQSFRRHAGR
jgi:hypothetical protein